MSYTSALFGILIDQQIAYDALKEKYSVEKYPNIGRYFSSQGYEYVWVEPASGMRSAAGCPGARMLPFARGSAPHTRSSCAVGESRSFLERLFD